MHSINPAPLFMLIAVNEAFEIAITLSAVSALSGVASFIWSFLKEKRTRQVEFTSSDGTIVKVSGLMPAAEIDAKVKIIHRQLDKFEHEIEVSRSSSSQRD